MGPKGRQSGHGFGALSVGTPSAPQSEDLEYGVANNPKALVAEMGWALWFV